MTTVSAVTAVRAVVRAAPRRDPAAIFLRLIHAQPGLSQQQSSFNESYHQRQVTCIRDWGLSHIVTSVTRIIFVRELEVKLHLLVWIFYQVGYCSGQLLLHV